jgi:hypothetical protein
MKQLRFREDGQTSESDEAASASRAWELDTLDTVKEHDLCGMRVSHTSGTRYSTLDARPDSVLRLRGTEGRPVAFHDISGNSSSNPSTSHAGRRTNKRFDEHRQRSSRPDTSHYTIEHASSEACHHRIPSLLQRASFSRLLELIHRLRLPTGLRRAHALRVYRGLLLQYPGRRQHMAYTQVYTLPVPPARR